MTLDQLITTHGYWVLALGCLLEGETVLLLAGYAAHRGNLDPFGVVAVAACAGFVGDQFYFWLGRRHGPAVLARWPVLGRQAQRVQRLLERFHEAVIVGVRFAYGLRIAGPILLGAGPISVWRFACFNAIGAVLWAALIGGIGWTFGRTAEWLLGEVRHVEGILLLVAASALVLAWYWRRRGRDPGE